jgi:hypothetical protein
MHRRWSELVVPEASLLKEEEEYGEQFEEKQD